MTKSSRMRIEKLLPRFQGLFFAVFNSNESDRKKARRRVISEFGTEAYNTEVKPHIRTGIMELFEHKPTRPLRRFAWYVALSADRRHRAAERAPTPE